MKTKMAAYWLLLTVGAGALMWTVMKRRKRNQIFQECENKLRTFLLDRSKKLDFEIYSLNKMIVACKNRVKESNLKKQMACTKLTWDIINKIEHQQSEILDASQEVYRNGCLVYNQLMNEIDLMLTKYEAHGTSNVVNDIVGLKHRFWNVFTHICILFNEQKLLLEVVQKLQPNSCRVQEKRGKEDTEGEDKFKKEILKKFESSFYQHQVDLSKSLEIIFHGVESYEEMVSRLEDEQHYWANSQDYSALLERTYWLRKDLKKMYTNLEFLDEHTANMTMVSKFNEIKHLLDVSEAIRITNILCEIDSSLSILRKKNTTCYVKLSYLLADMEAFLEPAWNRGGAATVAKKITEENEHKKAKTAKTKESSGFINFKDTPVEPEKIKKPNQKKKFQNKSNNAAVYNPESTAWPEAKVEARQNSQVSLTESDKAAKGEQIKKEALLNLANQNDIEELLEIAKLTAKEKVEKKSTESPRPKPTTGNGEPTEIGAGGAKKPVNGRRLRYRKKKKPASSGN